VLLVLLELVLGHIGTDGTESGTTDGSEKAASHHLTAGKGTGSTTSEGGQNASLAIRTGLALGGVVALTVATSGGTSLVLGLVVLRLLVSVISGGGTSVLVVATVVAGAVVVVSVATRGATGVGTGATAILLVMAGRLLVVLAALSTVTAVVFALRVCALAVRVVVVGSTGIWDTTLGIASAIRVLGVATLVVAVVGVGSVATRAAAGIWHSGALGGVLGLAAAVGRRLVAVSGAPEEVAGGHWDERRGG